MPPRHEAHNITGSLSAKVSKEALRSLTSSRSH